MDSQFKDPLHLKASESSAGAGSPEPSAPKMISHFRVEEQLGAGGMSVVYKCTDLAVNRIVAVKVLQPRLAAEEKWLLRFRQEAMAIGRLSHPNLVRFHHFDAEADEPYIVMDYVEGCSLSELLAVKGALSVPRSIKLMASVMDALAHAHANGVIHRDLKPSNIMVIDANTDFESVKILDFGIAKIEEDAGGYKLTQTGEIFGSPLYMSPEQCLGKVADDRSDQYSIGCVLYECLTGCPPFSGDNSMSILMKHLNDAPSSLKEASLGRAFPDGLEFVVRKLLEKDPQRRYASMSEAKQALENALDRKSSATAAPKTKDNAGNRQKAVWTATISGGVVLITLVLYGFWMLLGTSESIGPKVKEEGLIQEMDNDFGDKAIEEYLAQNEHRFFPEMDTGLHDFKLMTDKGLKLIAQMPNLRTLILTNCGNITADGLKYLWKEPQLQHLELTGTAIGDNAIPVIVQMKPLLSLNLSKTSVHPEGLKLLSQTKLNTLLVGNIDLDEAGCEAIAQIKSLQKLSLGKNTRVADGLKYIVTLPHLEALDLTNTRLTDKDLKELPRSKRLNKLYLSDNHITDAGIKTIAHIQSLENLFLDSTRIDDAALTELLKLKELRYLNLYGCKIDPSAIAKFGIERPECKVDLNPPLSLEHS
jgi:serine/threonine protein kinase